MFGFALKSLSNYSVFIIILNQLRIDFDFDF